jgi:hypothetical protein
VNGQDRDPLAELTLTDDEVQAWTTARSAVRGASETLATLRERAVALRAERDAVAAQIAERAERAAALTVERREAAAGGDTEKVAALACAMAANVESDEAQRACIDKIESALASLSAEIEAGEEAVRAAEAHERALLDAAAGRAPRRVIDRLAAKRIAAEAIVHIGAAAASDAYDAMSLLARLCEIPSEIARRAISDPAWLTRELRDEERRNTAARITAGREAALASESSKERRQREDAEAARRQQATAFQAAMASAVADATAVRMSVAFAGL